MKTTDIGLRWDQRMARCEQLIREELETDALEALAADIRAAGVDPSQFDLSEPEQVVSENTQEWAVLAPVEDTVADYFAQPDLPSERVGGWTPERGLRRRVTGWLYRFGGAA